MLHHLGVSIDSSDHCSEAAIQALQFASANSARISLWYAQGVPDGPLDQLRREHRASEALARVEAAAHAMGIPTRAGALFAAQPAHELLNAAQIAGCDAIVIVSEPKRLAENGTATIDMLSHASVPVLTFGSGCLPPRIAALELLHTEYQRLITLLFKWLFLLSSPDPLRQRTLDPYRAGMQAVVDHVRDTLHPLRCCKEAWFFGPLRQRIDDVRAEIDELLLLGQREDKLLDDLESKIAQPLDSESAVAALAVALEQYARQLWAARGRELGVILPAARRHLSASDWDRLHSGFVKTCGGSARTTGRFKSLSVAFCAAAQDGTSQGFAANLDLGG
ncbi:universal stress protein [Paraburkholderia tuberum]|uniref:Nucleotide-binding universal stress protein, UspA family n=1 Tax=Paraburkholderia tuberum TaxID=157910 RepID=A0A1H1KDL2_9BURK|nr:universal stress protein [Paraburkholderia tuberum]SDR60060.1 Nucleotide-binding universal stress protein, UspA family [Paraburkholderia tuberum]